MIERIKTGDKRRFERLLEPQYIRIVDDYGNSTGETIAVKTPVYVTVEETFNQYGEWKRQTIDWSTVRPAPTKWQRLKVWLMHPAKPSNLPEARVVAKG